MLISIVFFTTTNWTNLSLDDIADDQDHIPSVNDSFDQLIADDEAPEIDNQNDKDVTNINFEERLEAMSKSPNKSVGKVDMEEFI